MMLSKLAKNLQLIRYNKLLSKQWNQTPRFISSSFLLKRQHTLCFNPSYSTLRIFKYRFSQTPQNNSSLPTENFCNATMTDEKESKKDVDWANITTTQYYNIEANRYAGDAWVKIVANNFVELFSGIRPLKKGDVILDIGCGPGHTALPIMKAITPSKYYMVDLAENFIKLATENMKQFKDKETQFKIAKMDILGPRFDDLVKKQIKGIDCAVMSLVTEYITKENIIKLCTKVVENLNAGGIIALVEWGEHLDYPPLYGNGIKWQNGITKKDWLEIAAQVTETIENGARVKDPEKKKLKKAPREKYTVSTFCSTFEVNFNADDAEKQFSFLHSLVLRKDLIK